MEVETILPAVGSENFPTILIIEDEADIAHLLVYRLKREGFQALVAKDGEEGCRMIEAVRPDCILLDLLLPVRDGWSVCRTLRGHQDTLLAATPVVMLTALGDRETRIQGIETGADVFLSKTAPFREVLANCRRLVSIRRERSALHAEVGRLRSRQQYNDDLQSMLCHEVRNQLTVISGFCRRLARSLEGEKERRAVEAIRKSTQSLGSLAEEFLLYHRIEATDFSVLSSAIDPGVIIDEVFALYRPLAAAKGIGLELLGRLPATVRLNRSGLKIILSSLLENAIKYSPSATTVSLLAHSTGDEFFFEVSDRGPGVPDDEKERIFERHYRGRLTSDSTSGTGIGLFAARKLVLAMGGGIEVADRWQGGSVFLVWFREQDGRPVNR
ncbi:MAG: hybrid sensor histidine kinase/response regulator [Desulfobulbus sp.]|nr:MAG: hybrid sensor histidine kinase/response regulator [Desulfobulbus sp.]